MRLFITPADVWLFRGGLPFGEDATITSEFPPTPETMQGALRALIAGHHYGDLNKAFGDPDIRKLIGYKEEITNESGQKVSVDHYGRFRLHGYSLGVRDTSGKVTRLFPLPAHLFAQKHGDEEKATHWVYLPATGATEAQGNYPEGMRALNKQKGTGLIFEQGRDVRWIDETTLRSLLGSPEAQPVSDPLRGYTDGDLFDREMRPGIGMDRAKRTTSEGIFFRTEMIRLRNEVAFQVGLVADISLAPEGGQSGVEYQRAAIQGKRKLHDSGWMTIGGERRPATYEVIDNGDAPPAGNNSQNNGRTLLYFATPAYFKRGWRPEDWQATFGAQPVAAAIPRQQLIGGWQLTPGKPGGNATANSKVLRRCVPAGSVLFFDEPPSQPGPYSDYGKEIGFGLTIQGAW